jgi:uncharacterized membrane protein
MGTRAVVRPARWGIRQFIIVAGATALLTLTLMALSFGGGAPPLPDQAVNLPLIIHLGTVLPAVPIGAYLLLRPKGGRRHRVLGRIWAVLMMTTAISSFWLQSDGGLSFIHLFSVMTLVSVPLAVLWIRRRDVERHRRTMINIYIGLIIAGLFAFTPGRLLNVWLLG